MYVICGGMKNVSRDVYLESRESVEDIHSHHALEVNVSGDQVLFLRDRVLRSFVARLSAYCVSLGGSARG